MNIFNQFTLRTLRKNKIRTLVTIIGIALSVAMFTAVTSSITSFQHYLLDVEIVREGAWEGRMIATDLQSIQNITADKQVKSWTQMDNLGYAELKDCTNDDKPYLMIEAVDKDFTKYSPITLLEGRMPKDSSEIVISKHLEYNGGVTYKIGDTLKLSVGKRYSKALSGEKSEELTSNDPYRPGETVKEKSQKTYTVVGICDRPVSEDFSSAGYTAFTRKDDQKAANYDLFLTFNTPEQSHDIMAKYAKTGAYTTHEDLLRYEGSSSNDRFNRILYSMGAILMAIIMIGAISLIYSAFSISLSERTKQMGLLKSIGATKKQIRHSVIFEACVLCLAGIPLGIAAGLGGIGITLHGVSGLLGKIWADATDIQLHLVVTWQAIVVAIIVSFVTVLISAMIPAARAVRIPAIQAIRQSDDIKIRAGKVRTSGLTYKLFGFSGMLASKNFKRNRKKYRTTVFSLFISIVLFVSATSFSGYMKVSSSIMDDEQESYDISCSVSDNATNGKAPSEVAADMGGLSSVDSVSYLKENYNQQLEIPQKYLTDKYLSYVKKNTPDHINEKKGTVRVPVNLSFLQDDAYRTYLQENHMDVDKYMTANPMNALVWDRFVLEDEKKIYSMEILKKDNVDATLAMAKEIKGYYFTWQDGNDYIYVNEDSDKDKRISAEKAAITHPIHIGKKMTVNAPAGVSVSKWNEAVNVVLPYSLVKDGILRGIDSEDGHTRYILMAKQHEKASTDLSGYFEEELSGTDAGTIVDVAASRDSSQALILVLDIFSYGFIVLISLIALANVFNTISTNVMLRRQEFAMLKSVGMTGKGFRRMMNYECILYGTKGLLFGLPVSLALSSLMYKTMVNGIDVSFMFPWQGMLISAFSVFAIVFITMLYAMRKVGKENTIEALRNENL
ncbi:ABC transporter permease [Jutongia sp.]